MSGDLEGLVELGGVAVAEAALLAGHARTHCPNCGAKFDGPYCAHCGQERDTHRRTVGHLLHDFFEDILSFDSRILRTARALVSQPGELSCAFRDGRTRAYVPPIRLYFFVTLLFFLILSVSGIAILKLDVHTHIMTAKEVARIQKSVTASEATTKGAAGSGKVNFNLVVGGSNTIKAGATYPSFTTRFFAPLDTAPRSISPQVQKGLDQMKADFAKAKAAMAAKGEKPGFGDWIIDRIQTTMTTLAHDPTAINGPLTTWIPRALFLLLPIFARIAGAVPLAPTPDLFLRRPPRLLAQCAQLRLCRADHRGVAGAGPEWRHGRLAGAGGSGNLPAGGHEALLRPELGPDRHQIRIRFVHLHGVLSAARAGYRHCRQRPRSLNRRHTV